MRLTLGQPPKADVAIDDIRERRIKVARSNVHWTELDAVDLVAP
jgi:hypothetical protein